MNGRNGQNDGGRGNGRGGRGNGRGRGRENRNEGSPPPEQIIRPLQAPPPLRPVNRVIPVGEPQRLLRPVLRLRPLPPAVGINALMVPMRQPSPPPPPPPSPPPSGAVRESPSPSASTRQSRVEGEFKKGGMVRKTGLYKVHKGEVVVPASRAQTVRKLLK